MNLRLSQVPKPLWQLPRCSIPTPKMVVTKYRPIIQASNKTKCVLPRAWQASRTDERSHRVNRFQVNLRSMLQPSLMKLLYKLQCLTWRNTPKRTQLQMCDLRKNWMILAASISTSRNLMPSLQNSINRTDKMKTNWAFATGKPTDDQQLEKPK